MIVGRKVVFLVLLLRLSGSTTDKLSSPYTTPAAATPHIPTIVRTIKDKERMERIELHSPAHVNLSCVVADSVSGRSESIKGFWTKDGEKIDQSEIMIQREKDGYYQQKNFFIDAAKLGNYSCVFDHENTNVSKTFVIAAPSMKEKRDKPVMGYMGDFTVLTCKIKPVPDAWRWYWLNGTDKKPINSSADPLRYEVHLHEDEVRFSVKNLTEEDSGTYLCVAVYPIGTVEGTVVLQVITFMEPLKPFLGILVEVVLLVCLILTYEVRGRRKGIPPATENGLLRDQTEKSRQEESNRMEDVITARQRKQD